MQIPWIAVLARLAVTTGAATAGTGLALGPAWVMLAGLALVAVGLPWSSRVLATAPPAEGGPPWMGWLAAVALEGALLRLGLVPLVAGAITVGTALLILDVARARAETDRIVRLLAAIPLTLAAVLLAAGLRAIGIPG